MTQFRFLAALAAASLMGGVALAQAAQDQNAGVSTSVTAGPLNGQAQAGPRMNGRDEAANRDPNCTERSVTVQGPGGSSSVSASASSNGSTVVAGGGSPGSRTTYTECGRPDARPSQDDKNGDMK